MTLASQKSGTQFHKPAIKRHGQLTDSEWVEVMVSVGFPRDPRVLAEGLAVLHNESGGNTANFGQGAKGHIGAWAESPTFGTVAQRLDSVESTKAALSNWKENRKSSGSMYGNFEQAWGVWEAQQGGKNVQQEYQQYMGTAMTVLAKGNIGQVGTTTQYSGIPGLEQAEEIIGGPISSAEDFLTELASTLLDFRKLGQLAVSAFAWFLRLVAKAIWDYVIAPLWHWAERAETFYWRNFFGTGTEKGSGVGYLLRENAGIITIGFWAIGYAVLWSDGESLSPVESHESMFGRAIKGVEGKVARRNLVKPTEVESETPDKPPAKTSSVQIERIKEYSVNRKRPVSVGIPGGEDITGRNSNERGNGQVPRPGEASQKTAGETEGQKIIRVPEQRVKIQSAKTKPQTPKASAESGPGTRSRVDSGSPAKGSGGSSAEKRN